MQRNINIRPAKNGWIVDYTEKAPGEPARPQTSVATTDEGVLEIIRDLLKESRQGVLEK